MARVGESFGWFLLTRDARRVLVAGWRLGLLHLLHRELSADDLDPSLHLIGFANLLPEAVFGLLDQSPTYSKPAGVPKVGEGQNWSVSMNAPSNQTS